MSDSANATDRALVDRIKSRRDAAALAEVVRRYGGLVHGVCLRRCGADGAGPATVAIFRGLLEQPGAVNGPLPVWLHDEAVKRGDGGPGQAPAGSEEAWATVAPAIDTAIAGLDPQQRWHLLTALYALPPRGHAHAQARDRDEALAQPLQESLTALSAKLSATGITHTPADLEALLDRNVIELPPPALAAELGRLALGALPTSGPAPATGRRAKLVWSLAIGGLAYVIIMAVVIYALSEYSAMRNKEKQRGAESASPAQPTPPSR